MNKTKKKKLVNKAYEIQRIFQALRYYTNYDYDTVRDGCGCESICRCSKITNARILDVDTLRLSKDIGVYLDTEIDEYCVERILARSGLHDRSAYDISIVSGYYGQEIGNVTFRGTSLVPEILNLLGEKDDLVKILKTLKYEYGYILPSLMNKTKVEIKEVAIASISAGQTDHYKRLDRDAIERYKEAKSTLPQMVVVEDNGYFRLIDGYHRYAAAQGKDKVKVIILS
jgi:hypothetical protein